MVRVRRGMSAASRALFADPIRTVPNGPWYVFDTPSTRPDHSTQVTARHSSTFPMSPARLSRFTTARPSIAQAVISFSISFGSWE